MAFISCLKAAYVKCLNSNYHAYVDSFVVDLQVDDLFPGFEDPQFPESDVEGRGEVGAVGLLHHNHVDCARQSRPVDLAIPVPDGPGQGGEKLAHFV